MVRDRRADRACAGYDDSSHPLSSWRSPSLSCRSGRRTSSRIGTPRSPRMNFSAAWRGKRSTVARSSPSSIAPASVGSRTTAATLSGNAAARPETAPTAPAADAVEDQRLGADEDVESLDQVRREAVERCVGDLEADEVRRALAQREQHVDRDGVAARTLELVDVEGRRRAGGRGGCEVVEQRPLVELEVRRADHCDRIDSGGGGVLDERQRVGGGLRAAMGRDLETARRGLDEELERTPPLGRVEEQPFSRRSEGKEAVDPGRDEEVDVRAESVLVETVVRERRDCGGESTSEHGATLLAGEAGLRRGSPASAGRYFFFSIADELVELAIAEAAVEAWAAVERVRPAVARVEVVGSRTAAAACRGRQSPSSVSLPAPPSTRSAPAPPSMLSSPASPRSRSLPAEPGDHGRSRRGRRSSRGRAFR